MNYDLILNEGFDVVKVGDLISDVTDRIGAPDFIETLDDPIFTEERRMLHFDTHQLAIVHFCNGGTVVAILCEHPKLSFGGETIMGKSINEVVEIFRSKGADVEIIEDGVEETTINIGLCSISFEKGHSVLLQIENENIERKNCEKI